eukprot:438339-Amphidinium_carterae.4
MDARQVSTATDVLHFHIAMYARRRPYGTFGQGCSVDCKTLECILIPAHPDSCQVVTMVVFTLHAALPAASTSSAVTMILQNTPSRLGP